MLWNTDEIVDLLLNHPSHWKIEEMIKANREHVAHLLLDAVALQMQHSLEKNQLNDHIHYLNEAIFDLTKKNEKLSNENGQLKLKIKELQDEAYGNNRI